MYESYCYLLVKTKKEWDGAKSYCQNQGGHLAKTTSSGVNNFILNLVNSNGPEIDDIWHGLRYNGFSCKWTDGTSATYTNWAFLEPNLFLLSSCGKMKTSGSSGKWFDALAGTKLASVCRKPRL